MAANMPSSSGLTQRANAQPPAVQPGASASTASASREVSDGPFDDDPKADLYKQASKREDMGRCVSGVIAAFATLSLAFLVLGAVTQRWVELSTSGGKRNPVLINARLAKEAAAGAAADTTKRVEYFAAHYGLWNACYRERGGALSCATTSLSCTARVCWIRVNKAGKQDTACRSSGVAPLRASGVCVAFQFTRIFIAAAILLGAFGTASAIVATVAPAPAPRSIGMLAGIAEFLAGLSAAVAFVVFYVACFTRGGLKDIAALGWSFWLVVIAWPIMILVGVISCCNASLAESPRDVADQSVQKEPSM